MTATFGLKGAHAESADEFDVLLDDVESAGLNGVNRLSPGGRQDQGMSVTTHAGSSCRRILERKPTTMERAAVAGSVAKLRIRRRERERWRRLAAFLHDSRKIGRENILPVVPCAQRAQPSTLTPGASMPCGAPRVQERGSIELVSVELWRRYQRRRCCSSSVEVRILQADHSRRWRGPALCAPRIRRAAFLREALTATSAAACVSSAKPRLLIRSF